MTSTHNICYQHSIEIFLIGGSLVLAEGGICVVGNLSSQKKDVRDSLQKSIINIITGNYCMKTIVITFNFGSSWDRESDCSYAKETGSGGYTTSDMATSWNGLGMCRSAAEEQGIR